MTVAASHVGIQQAAVSRAVQRLEARYNRKLFRRDQRRVLPTDFGERLLAGIAELASIWQEKENQIWGLAQEVRGHYRIGCHLVHALSCLPPVIQEASLKYPELDLEIQIHHSHLVCRKVADGDLDLGLAIEPLRLPRLVLKKLRTEHIHLCQRSTEGTAKNLSQSSERVVLLNPEMIGISRVARVMKTHRVVSLPSYDLIASSLLKSSRLQGFLPTGVLSRYPKLRILETFSEGALYLVYREDLVKNPASEFLLRSLSEASKQLSVIETVNK